MRENDFADEFFFAEKVARVKFFRASPIVELPFFGQKAVKKGPLFSFFYFFKSMVEFSNNQNLLSFRAKRGTCKCSNFQGKLGICSCFASLNMTSNDSFFKIQTASKPPKKGRALLFCVRQKSKKRLAVAFSNAARGPIFGYFCSLFSLFTYSIIHKKMKQLNILSLFLCLLAVSAFAQPHPTSVLTEDYQPSTSAFSNSAKTLYFLNANGKPTLAQDFKWSATKWDIQTKTDYTYNAAGKVSEQVVSQVFMGSSFPQARFRYEYDASGNQTHYYEETYDGAAWVVNAHFESQYNAAGKLTLYLYEKFNAGAIEYGTRQTLSYDAQNRRDKVFDEFWLNGAWIFNQRALFTYANGTTEDFLSTISNSYNPNNGAWGTATRRIKGVYTVANGEKTLVETTENLSGSGWVGSYRQTITQKGTAATDPQILNRSETLPPGTTTWAKQSEVVTTLNADNSANVRTLSDIYNSTQSFKPKTRWTFAYGQTVADEDVLADFSVKIFPNPAQDFLIVELGERTADVELFDASGRSVRRAGLASGQVSLEIGGLPAGQYFVKTSGAGQRAPFVRAVVKN